MANSNAVPATTSVAPTIGMFTMMSQTMVACMKIVHTSAVNGNRVIELTSPILDITESELHGQVEVTKIKQRQRLEALRASVPA